MRRLITTVAILAGLFGPASASAAEKAIWGPLDMPGGGSAFPTYRALGVDTFQTDLNFARTAPTAPAQPTNPNDPAYRWPAAADRAVREATANGIAPAFLVSQSPSWANGGRSTLHVPQPAAFADFLTAASRRYPSVRRWMIWGEPNRSDRFQPNSADTTVGARAYAPLLDAAYRALKRRSRRNVVIGGMTWTGGDVKPTRFLSGMKLPNGRRPRLDWFGHNPYPFRFPDLREIPVAGGFRDISDLDTFSRELRRAYRRSVKLWLSEFTIQSDRRSRVFEHFVTREQQAAWLTAAFRIADRLETVAGIGWFRLTDEAPASGSSNWGLITAAGEPKPALSAFDRAPSVRRQPRVGAPRRVRRRSLKGRGVRIRILPQVGGRVAVELRSRSGRRLGRVARRARAGRAFVIRLRVRRPRRCRCVLRVTASGAATLRRPTPVR